MLTIKGLPGVRFEITQDEPRAAAAGDFAAEKAKSSICGRSSRTPTRPCPSTAAGSTPHERQSAASATSSTIDRLFGEVARFRAYPHFDRAYRLMSQGRDRDALPEIEAGLKHEPANTAARLAWVDALTRLGRREQALRQASLALTHDTHHPGALRRRAS